MLEIVYPCGHKIKLSYSIIAPFKYEWHDGCPIHKHKCHRNIK